KNHGLVATGENLLEATLLAEFVEETAKTQFISRVLGNIKDLQH
ncbi:MAG TPA: class II aldolase/adducin family protein, partial [Methanobacterium sp.]|nr:class II aldolase/adducin family protein [Methanobacterium sp.]